MIPFTSYPNFNRIKEYLAELEIFDLQEIHFETESQEYEACEFVLNRRKIKFRSAKTTPKKKGQFVTIWKRHKQTKETMPWDKKDDIHFLMLFTHTENRKGFFLFPAAVLEKHGLLTTDVKTGKRGFRIYSPWDEVTSTQAQKTKAWQLPFFRECNKQCFLEVLMQLK